MADAGGGMAARLVFAPRGTRLPTGTDDPLDPAFGAVTAVVDPANLAATRVECVAVADFDGNGGERLRAVVPLCRMALTGDADEDGYAVHVFSRRGEDASVRTVPD